MEIQICFLSLNRAGDYYGDSLFCTPWVDESSPGIRLRRTAEEYKTIEIDTNLIGNVRREYSLLHDRMGDYSALVPLGRSPCRLDSRVETGMAPTRFLSAARLTPFASYCRCSAGFT